MGPVAAQPLAHLAIEVRQVLVGEAVGQRQHRNRVLHGGEFGRRRTRHALRRRVRRDQFRMRRLERAQFVHEPVVFGVRHRRLVENVVAVVVAVDFVAQLRDALRSRRFRHRSGLARGPRLRRRFERLAQPRDALWRQLLAVLVGDRSFEPFGERARGTHQLIESCRARTGRPAAPRTG